MGMTAVKIKIMPSSPEANLEDIQGKIKEKLENNGALNISFEKQPIAFGLKAIIVQIAWPEEKPTDFLENLSSELENISSSEIIDYRRAFG
jgi:elongation factor 1-beta